MTNAICFKMRAGRPSGPVALLTSMVRKNLNAHLSLKQILSSRLPSGGCQVGSGRVAGGNVFFISHVTANKFAFCSGSNSHSSGPSLKAGMLEDFGLLLSRTAFNFHHLRVPQTLSWRRNLVLAICLRYSSYRTSEQKSRAAI